ncbi:FecR family protein [Dyadobacter sp. CY261]|uniref:FecR family protein n=1 Tax=Dyadobacter sp. CY261 TaxID=2907203 RepID=UPI001F31E2FF|nr:FecR family protein [Dyadobacter sp. CY261]MCF0072940.1 FecR family protein [Dyadobacter sp. CY261]
MNKRHFHHLLTRYRSGECTEREAKLVDQWFALIDGDGADFTDRQSQETEARLWQAIQARTQSATRFQTASQTEKIPKVFAGTKPLHFFFKWRWVAAAVLVLVAWGGYEWSVRNTVDNGDRLAAEAPANLLTKTNTTGEPVWVLLSDGSRVSLQPQSTIRYPADFQNYKREIYLKGKAFFEVTRDERKPFLVYTGEITTKVLGTSFWINRSQASSDVEVSVVTGKVSVFQKDKEKEANAGDLVSGVILSRNQSVKYAPGKIFAAMLVKRPVAGDGYKTAFVFDDTRLGEVAQTLEKAYGIDIVLTSEKLKNCLFTADINKQPMFTQLDLIAASVNATYTVKGTKIYLSGKGCP